MGIGAIPLWTTGFAHVEQQSWKKNAPLSFGLINGASATGKRSLSQDKRLAYVYLINSCYLTNSC